MSARAGAADTNNKNMRLGVIRILFSCVLAGLAACTGGFETDPLVEYSTDLVVNGSDPARISRYLGPGIYLVEIRERDIDLRVGIDAGAARSELADAYLRHGLHRTVVRLDSPARLAVTLRSVDVRSWKGAAAIRILRWPQRAAGTTSDQRLLGFEALGRAGELVARGTPEASRAALESLLAAERHFRQARDPQALAETEYRRAWLELGVLFDCEAARRTADSALAHFRDAGDETGARRADLLLALAEFGSARRMAGGVPRSRQHALLELAERRATQAQIYFETQDLQSDSLRALGAAQLRNQILGREEHGAAAFETMRRRARTRGDDYFEASAAQGLGLVAQRKGELLRAVRLFEGALPLIDRNRDPTLYANLVGNLGYALLALGEFDRALALHAEALGLFGSLGDDSQTARELVALAAIRFRSGDLESSLAAVQDALPRFEHTGDRLGAASALRLAGSAAAGLGRHDDALRYLRAAERSDTDGIDVDRTRVLIAGELRALGRLDEAGLSLDRILATNDQSLRAEALLERALLRQQQGSAMEALADLREADGIYARLGLDFKRIGSSSALALALLDAGEIAGANAAAEIAVTLERRTRAGLANPEVRAHFLSATYAPYEARIEVDLAAAPLDSAAAWRAFRTAEAIRARSLGDRLAQRATSRAARTDAGVGRLRTTLTELQFELDSGNREGDGISGAPTRLRRYMDEIRALLEARLQLQGAVEPASETLLPESIAEAQAALPANTAVLAYFVGDRRSHAWLLTRSGLRHSVLPGRQALEDLVREFVEYQRGNAGTASGDRFATLSGGLLAGVEARRLVVLADGPLHGLPFAALPMRTHSRQLLVDRFVISTTPSLALALRPAAPHDTPATRVAVVYDPVYTPDDRRLTSRVGDASRFRGHEAPIDRLARLPYSAIEARAVKRAFPGVQVMELAGLEANAQRVIELPARDLNLLHFATHAVSRRDAPGLSALYLSEYAADGSPQAIDRLTADEVTRSGLRADIVVLSGCATGDGAILRGEGVLGLSYGFLANGSNAVIATLWPVEDALTARFMEHFYSAYRASGRAADALRIAQLRSRDSDGSQVWSSFVVRASGFP